jgi:hypothetical protein
MSIKRLQARILVLCLHVGEELWSLPRPMRVIFVGKRTACGRICFRLTWQMPSFVMTGTRSNLKSNRVCFSTFRPCVPSGAPCVRRIDRDWQWFVRATSTSERHGVHDHPYLSCRCARIEGEERLAVAEVKIDVVERNNPPEIHVRIGCHKRDSSGRGFSHTSSGFLHS